MNASRSIPGSVATCSPEAIDAGGADLVIHGHAHGGREKGTTPGGTPVRNVAQPLIQRAYSLYCLGSEDDPGC